MFINVHHQKIKTPSPKQKKTAGSTATSTTQQQAITHSSSKHHSTITETSPKHARDVTNTSLKDPQNTTKKTTKQHRHSSKKGQRPRHDRDMTETSPRQDRDNTKATPRHHQKKTETGPRHDRDMNESMNFSILKHHPSTYGPQLHWFAQRCTIYKFKLEFEILLRNPIKTFITKKSKHHHQRKKKKALQHQRINDTTPSHNPLIIKTSQHRPHTSRRLHRYMPETSPTHH